MGKLRAMISMGTTLVALALPMGAYAQGTEVVLGDFALGGGTGASMVLDSAGNLYGNTTFGVGSSYGSVFQLARGSDGIWKQKVLYDFTGFGAGAFPYSGVVIDTAGNLYGTTFAGGNQNERYCGGSGGGCGLVFEVSPTSGGGWHKTVLYDFAGGQDGAFPEGGMVLGADGILYGTTNGGGSAGVGVVFQLAPTSLAKWRERILHTFQDSDGEHPQASLIIDAAGNLYGTTTKGGDPCNLDGCGVVFELSPNSDGSWKETLLHSFTGGADGAVPMAGLILDTLGNLYGTTYYGGITGGCPSAGGVGCGVVFELSPTAYGWKQTVLHAFTGGEDGGNPTAGVTLDAAGNLFGTTTDGGLSSCVVFYSGCGVVFELTKRADGAWSERVLHAFTDGRDGATPTVGLTLGSGDNLYGATINGGNPNCGNSGCGVAFEITP